MNSTIRRFTAIALIVLLALFVAVATTHGASPQAGQCAGYNDPTNTKIDTSDGSIVLPAGLTACFKAGNGNTGPIVTDGVSTIAMYIEASGLLNNGGQVPGISNYVIYGTSTPPPSENPTVAPTDEPDPTDCEGCGEAHEPSMPNTSTAGSNAGPTAPGRDGLLLMAALIALAMGSMVLAPARRNSR